MKRYLRILRGHPRPARFLAARLMVATGLCRLARIPQRGYALRFHPANLSSQLWIDPACRDAALAFFRDYPQAGDRVVDVGANVGDTTLTAALRVGDAGRVLALEPHPRTFGYLAENVRLNRMANVDLVHAAAGAAEGVVRLTDDRRDDMNRVDAGGIQVPMRRLDAIVADTLPVALLKVDVEGYERFVLEGASRLLARTACVHFEVSSVHFARFGYRTRDVLVLLESAGFRLYRVAGTTLASIGPDFDSELDNLAAVRDPADFARRTGWSVA